MAERLYRSRDDRMLAGVAGGVAEALDADPSLVRIVWALLVIFTGGIAFLVYIVMAIVVPVAPDGWQPSAAGGAWVGGTAGGSSAAGPAATGASATGASGASGAVVGSASAGTPDASGAQGATTGAAGFAGPVGSSWQADREARRAARRAHRREPDGRGAVIGGVVLIVIGAFFLLRQFGLLLAWDLWWPIGLIAVGVLLLVFALFPSRPSE